MTPHDEQAIQDVPEPSNADFGDTPDSVRNWIHYLECQIAALAVKPQDVGDRAKIISLIEWAHDVAPLGDHVSVREFCKEALSLLRKSTQAKPPMPDDVREAVDFILNKKHWNEWDIQERRHAETLITAVEKAYGGETL